MSNNTSINGTEFYISITYFKTKNFRCRMKHEKTGLFVRLQEKCRYIAFH